jgi:two-component system, sensor histidine kinase and response regulator
LEIGKPYTDVKALGKLEIRNPEIKILLVDDREDNLFSIETVLEKDGYTLMKANSGKQALKVLLKEYDFTLILMDVQMPNLNGFETASLIYDRDKLKHIPIIFITANNYNDDNAFKGYQAGAVDYIYKPINPELLRAKVSVFVDLYKKNHQLLAQEQKLISINNELEERVKERTEELSKKNLELEFKNIELLKVNNDLDNFIYTASHDLKAPVSNIEGLVISLVDSLSESASEDENVKTIIGMINTSIHRFKGTIQDLTEITKIQKGIEENNTIVDCHEIIEDVKSTINELIVESQAKITVNIKDCPQISFSRKNLKSIIYNLLSNAIKYRSPKRNPEISIKTQRSDGFIILTIKDNGLGMNLQDKNKIFSMFKRLHDHVEGSGIGLYIVKRIIDNSGGKIEVESIVGKGSTFSVYFKDHQLARK